ncbi:DUF3606 domain-containing protein [Cupriavidus malaysiensis]|uniref:DUF3606 domain-containing protein n=1 Tax=Cupriavidus malaysiensis TaxID=367825 RepID=A0ABN4TR73_9BURK|nr:DUF3606 domain-containing protein [Cupriavidus malaysiensis]AOZ06784.1 hypothetical protein BKK80_13875 [Cupriavidus malaysiensis]
MADDLKKKDGRDRAKVNKSEAWEVNQVAKKHGVTPAVVKKALEKVGPVRTRVEQEIKKSK